MNIEDAAHGVVGITKAILGVDAASEKTIRERFLICQGCDRYKHFLCLECGCIVAAKLRIFDEKCPLQKWSAE